MELAGVVVGLAPDGRAALGAHVVVLAAGGKDQQELLARRRRAPAPRAEEAGRLELLEAVAWRRHRRNSTPGPIMPARFLGGTRCSVHDSR